MKPGAVAVFGEVLFDRFADGTERLGGAPLNVAAHLAALGDMVQIAPLMISRVGNDEPGRRALDELAARGLDTRGIQIDAERATGAVEVRIEHGEPCYEIVADRAWDHIDVQAAIDALADRPPSLLVHGVLATRSPASREALAAVRRVSRAPRLIDVNLRPPDTPADRALDLARGAAWLKLNESELEELAAAMAARFDPRRDHGTARPDGDRAHRSGTRDEAQHAFETALALRDQAGSDRVVVTAGARGALLVGPGGEQEQVPAAETARGDGDTVGAGDAFTAALVLGICGDWPPRLTLERAAELAAAVCTLRGALPPDQSFYAPFRRAWGSRG